MKMKALLAALIIAGLAAPTVSVDAKTKHHKAPHSKSMSKGSGSGAGDTSGQGNVGPGTTNTK
jgi:hypothetical protein